MSRVELREVTVYRVCAIEPMNNSGGSISESMPQSRCHNAGSVRPNRYGAGPFCKFKIPNGRNVCGMYAIAVEDKLKYIGESVNLSSRYNMGYGTIFFYVTASSEAKKQNGYRGRIEQLVKIANTHNACLQWDKGDPASV